MIYPEDRIELCNIRVYVNGLVVITKDHRTGERTYEQLVDQSKQKRTYMINRSKVKSACIAAWRVKTSKNMLFLTFTFPFVPTEVGAARIWNNMLKNLKQNYHVKNYVWVKERQKSGRLHYHILIDRDRIGIINLQRSWNSAILHICPHVFVSNNSVRLGGNPVVRSIESVARYLSKYIAKVEGDDRCAEFERKAYGFSEHLVISKDIDYDYLVDLNERYGCRLVFDESFCEVWKLNVDFIEFDIGNIENTS